MGIIPARAGFTYRRFMKFACYPDHPRSRGVYPAHPHGQVGGGGSSPLARGLPSRIKERDGDLRIIPARAGFTASVCAWTRAARDHPRSRGVYGAP